MDYDQIIKECEARAEMYKRTGAVWNATHEEQCKTAITELLELEESLRNQRVSILYEDEILTIPEMCNRLRRAESKLKGG